jgi:hypothetical protein
LAGSILGRPSCGGVPFHTSSDKTEQCGSVGQGQRPTLAGPLTGKVLAAGAPRVKVHWWNSLTCQALARRMLDFRA